MAFTTSIACEFSQIDRRPDRTIVICNLVKLTDGGLDKDGNQLINRTLLKALNLRLDAGWDKQRLLAHFVTRLAAINTATGLNISPANFICDIQ